jgi:hypothetical protein
MVDFETRVAQYVQLRDMIDKETQEFKERIKPKKEMLEMLNNLLLHMLQQTKQTSANTKAGTVYRKAKNSATLADASLFRQHVISAKSWDLLDWKANVTAVAEMVEKTGTPPPGVNFNTLIDVGVRRSNGKKG